MMRFTIVDHCFVDRVARLVRKDASRQTRHHFLTLHHHIHTSRLDAPLAESKRTEKRGHVCFFGAPEQVVVHEVVVTVKVQLVLHVLEETTDHGRQVDHMRRLVFLEERFRVRHIPDECVGKM